MMLHIVIMLFSFTLFLACEQIMMVDETACYFCPVSYLLRLFFLNNRFYMYLMAFIYNSGIYNKLLLHLHHLFLSFRIKLVIHYKQLHMFISTQLLLTYLQQIDIFIADKDTLLWTIYFNGFAYLVAPHLHCIV